MIPIETARLNSPSPKPQFRLQTLFFATGAFAVVFATFRWLGLSPRTSLFVSGVAIACLLAAAVLMGAIARSLRDENRRDC